LSLYRVYFEVADDGLCMAHVPELPGCTVRAPSREEALRRLPDAMRAYLGWLKTHGEPAATAGQSIELEEAGSSTGFGPFDPGNAAALWPTDREAVSPEDMESALRRMDYARADLLALVGDLPDGLLDWQPDPDAWPLRRVLRHVGHAEKWYTSRLLPEQQLPPEWEHDEGMPLLDYLGMTRRTAVACLRQLGPAQRAALVYPALWTEHPEEGWTLRKVLRRFQEHELEHTGQVREILATWRLYYQARTATARAGLLASLIGLDEATLTGCPVFDDWTAKDLLAHVAAWDETHWERMQAILAGRAQELQAVDTDARNAALHIERRDWPLERVLERLTWARAAYLQTLAGLSDEDLHRLHSTPLGEVTLRYWAERRPAHDGMHTADVETWRKANRLRGMTGPKSLLLAELDAAREELLAAAALVPAAERASRPVCGVWTLQDMLGHVADWEQVAVDVLREMAAGRNPVIDIPDMEAWNQDHCQARRGQPWEVVWADLHRIRAALRETMQGMRQEDLARSAPNPWDPRGTPYRWVRQEDLGHDRHHAEDVRKAMGVAAIHD